MTTAAHVLDRPVWSSLATRHAAFAVGGDRARRFAPDINPLAGARDDAAESLAELARLVPADGPLLLLQADPVALPAGMVVASELPAVQMVLERLPEVPPDPRIVALAVADAPAMLALARLTNPGPFSTRTPELGEFFGVKGEGGALVAMAGERMKHPGYSEISGVCTHPDARGRGFARSLSAHVARRILERGETPYLHAYASNTPAIELYASLGFRLRAAMHVVAIARSASAG
jgi:ribosomal protein S18 acetylase RimI-like enzyme